MLRVELWVLPLNVLLLELQTLRPLTPFKNAPNPKCVQNLSRRLGSGRFFEGFRGFAILETPTKIMKLGSWKLQWEHLLPRPGSP